MKTRIVAVLWLLAAGAVWFAIFDIPKLARRSEAMAKDSEQFKVKANALVSAANEFETQAKPFLNRFEGAIDRLEAIRNQKKSIAKQIDDLVVQRAQIDAAVDKKNSLSSIISASIRALFDGFTLGQYAEEGVFTENKKAERFFENVAVNNATIKAQFDILARDYRTLATEEEQLCQAIRPNVLNYEQLKLKEKELRAQWQNIEVRRNELITEVQSLKTRMWLDIGLGLGIPLVAWILNGSKRKGGDQAKQSTATH